MSSRLISRYAVAAVLAAASSVAAQAQTLPYGNMDAAAEGDDVRSDGDHDGQTRQSRIEFAPYIEVGQVGLFELSPGSDVVTYSVVAAGVDTAINGRNNQGSLSVRYERRFGWEGDVADSDTISGVARYTGAIVPQSVYFEAGAMAARTSVEQGGSTVIAPLGGGDRVTQVYSVYAGPTLAGRVGDVAVTGGYRLGYTRVDSPNALVVTPGQPAVDVFDDSVVHNANIRAAVKPGDVLPVGVGVGASYNREDISNLDQRVEDAHVRGDVTLPVGNDVALVAGLGYEKVQVSARNAVVDGAGVPIIGRDGRFVTDKTGPRVLAYDVEGLTWDAGVMWRPSKRTALEAHVGRRYGSTTYYGSFAYAPDARTSINVSVYDNISGLGGQLNSALAGLPTEFQTSRNPLTGDINSCVVAQAGGTCFGGALGSVRSSVFRSRGVMASYGVNFGRFQAGVAGGYDRRKFIGAPGTVLASANGTVDENIWLATYLSGQIDRNSRFATNFYANHYQSGDGLTGDVAALGATAAYMRSIGGNLTATAAVGVDGVSREDTLEDQWTASALVGLRYTF